MADETNETNDKAAAPVPEVEAAPAPASEAPAAAAPAGAAPVSSGPPSGPAPGGYAGRPPYGGGQGDQGGPMRPRGPRRFQRRKVCHFCVEKLDYVDYKDAKLLRRFVSERGKILPRRITGTCAAHQRMLTVAAKRARIIALVPFKTD